VRKSSELRKTAKATAKRRKTYNAEAKFTQPLDGIQIVYRATGSSTTQQDAKVNSGRPVMPDRLADLVHFYEILGSLEQKLGGKRALANCTGKMGWPKRGVYFFTEAGENRSDSGTGPRIVRVGTHALTATSKATLWNRLSQHRGPTKSGGGSHRASVFRRLVG
jgi:hypothetical protein